MAALDAFLNSEAGKLLAAMLVVAFADFVTGTFAALRDGTFALDALAAWLRKHIAGRVGPIGALLVLGYFGNELVGQVFMGGALVAAGAYVAETAASILGNIAPPKESDVKEATAASTINPVPED